MVLVSCYVVQRQLADNAVARAVQMVEEGLTEVLTKVFFFIILVFKHFEKLKVSFSETDVVCVLLTNQ